MTEQVNVRFDSKLLRACRVRAARAGFRNFSEWLRTIAEKEIEKPLLDPDGDV